MDPTQRTVAFNGLYIPFPAPGETIGGPISFMRNLRREMSRRGVPYAASPRAAKLMFFPIAAEEHVVLYVKMRGGRIVQRLDGIHYPQAHTDYEERNAPILNIYRHFADHVVFQSEYSRRQCFTMLGEKCTAEYTIIPNGADTDLFFPAEMPPPTTPFRFVTTGNFRHREMISKVVEALDIVSAHSSVHFYLHVAGEIAHPDIPALLERPYIVYEGKQDLHDLCPLLRSCHAAVQVIANPNCQNSIMEAVSSGLPVIAFDTGSIGEFCTFNRDLLAPVLVPSHPVFHAYADFLSEHLAEKILLLVNNYEYFMNTARRYSNIFNMRDCCERYLDVFALQLEKTTTSLQLKEYVIPFLTSTASHFLRKKR
ncbi:glycosyltransferase [Desulfomicrobium baculatum]|uniref:Glycosyltransferase-like protein n=1 Tax=Desulfomicrobium baculatum (strain DSM 4028 / VKM B-1378 / X) TaxID=525897 RepID=C7LP37_DESBD|nr:glycosyltransferase [Desulfomicrobium baculatum]ACU91353.1 Glycosyltransferase-like protein [Desulfomicrobium baculatum DSM 4028]